MTVDTSIAKSVDVSVRFKGKPVPGQVPGGIKIVADGEEVTRYRNQESSNKKTKKDLEYKGEYIDSVMRQLTIELLILNTGSFEGTNYTQENIAKPDPDRREYRCVLDEWWSEIVLSRLDGVHLRVAFQCEWDIDEEPKVPGYSTFHVPLKSALGYAVDMQEFSEEVLECSHEVMEYMRECGQDEHMFSTLRENTQKLEEVID